MAQEPPKSAFQVKIKECRGMNRAAGEYVISGTMISKKLEKDCPFNWYVGNENQTDPYIFKLPDCELNIEGEAYFIYTSEGFATSGTLNTQPKTFFYEKLNCN